METKVNETLEKEFSSANLVNADALNTTDHEVNQQADPVSAFQNHPTGDQQPLIDSEDSICCDAFSIQYIDRIKSELISEIMLRIPQSNRRGQSVSKPEPDTKTENIPQEVTSQTVSDEEKIETISQPEMVADSSDQKPQDQQMDETADSQNLLRQAADLLSIMPSNDVPELKETPDKSEAIDSKEESFPETSPIVMDFENEKRDLDLFRQADKLLQDVQPDAAASAKNQPYNYHDDPTAANDVKSPYDFDFIW